MEQSETEPGLVTPGAPRLPPPGWFISTSDPSRSPSFHSITGTVVAELLSGPHILHEIENQKPSGSFLVQVSNFSTARSKPKLMISGQVRVIPATPTNLTSFHKSQRLLDPRVWAPRHCGRRNLRNSYRPDGINPVFES